MADKKISALTSAAAPLAGTEVLPIVQSGSTVKVAVSDLTAGRAVNATQLTLSAENLIIGATGKGVTTGSAIPLGFGVNNTVTAMTINTAGNVGFGTSTISAIFGTTVRIFNAGNGGTLQVGGTTVNSYLYASEGLGQSSLGNSSNHPFAFFTNDIERMRIAAAGDITVSTGNLVIGTAAKGIDFSANTHATGMTSELLDWYEEGDFTVTAGASSGLNGTWTAGTGKYTRIGNRVEFSIEFTGVNIGFSSLLGYYNFSGLPFTCAAEGASGSWATLSVSGALAGAVIIVGASTEFWLYAPNNTGTAGAVVASGTYRV